MTPSGLVNGWSATETFGLAALMVVTLLGALYRKPVASALAEYTRRPRVLPREDDPERIQQMREHHAWLARIYRPGLVFIAVFVWLAAIAALIDGREGPLFDALL